MRSFSEKIRDYVQGFPAVRDRWKGFTFSQYAEDVIINCILLPKRDGFYIDVGAYHPWRGSNTYRFYLTGWKGITVEPNPSVAADFRRLRPRDKHLTMGVASRPDTLTYYMFNDGKLNSFDGEQARRMSQPVIGKETVECLPLRTIVEDHAAGRHIDLLSVDCEGLDLPVLESLDWTATRPSVVVVEDYEQFRLTREGGVSPIRSFLQDNSYATFAQSAFSFHYIDTLALGKQGAGAAFNLADTQLDGLRRHKAAN